MRIAFLGTPAAAVPALRALLHADDVEVAAVVTNPDRPSGRGRRLQPPPVKVAASEAGVEIWQPQRPRHVRDELAALGLDAAAVVAYGALLPADVLEVPAKGFVNLHFSLLPRWRGAAPVQHALLAGDAETGVTCFVLDEGMDTGPVLLERGVAIGADETAGELVDRLAQLGAPLLVDAVRGLVDGHLQPVAQDPGAATLAPKIATADAVLDWSRPAVELERAVRAYNPAPGASTSFRGARLKVHRARRTPDRPGTPGTVVGVEGGPVVACGEDALVLSEVQPAGRARMSGEAFANGNRPAGVVLGADPATG